VNAFARHIGIDYSGAQTPTASLQSLRVYLAETDVPPVEVPPSPRNYWPTTRTLVGIDHGFSFPLRYFETHGIPAPLADRR
jgi:hypothetical protein